MGEGMAIAAPWGEGCHFFFFRQQDHVQSVPETAHVETSLISTYIQRLTGLWVGLTGTDHPLSIVFSATGVAKEAGGKSGSAGPGFREEAIVA